MSIMSILRLLAKQNLFFTGQLRFKHMTYDFKPELFLYKQKSLLL